MYIISLMQLHTFFSDRIEKHKGIMVNYTYTKFMIKTGKYILFFKPLN